MTQLPIIPVVLESRFPVNKITSMCVLFKMSSLQIHDSVSLLTGNNTQHCVNFFIGYCNENKCNRNIAECMLGSLLGWTVNNVLYISQIEYKVDSKFLRRQTTIVQYEL